MLPFLLATSLAAGPSASIVDGAIVGSVTVAAPPARILSDLKDPTFVSRVDGGKTEVSVRGADGACQIVDFVSPSTFLKVEYAVRRCPTDDGFQTALLSSNTFETYGTTWRVEPAGTGSTVHYRLEMTSALTLVPTSLALSSSVGPVRKLMKRFEAHYGAAEAASPTAP